MVAPATHDRQLETYALFNARLAQEIRALLTPALIEEHRQTPLGRQSDALSRVVNFFRRPAKYGLYARRPMREWVLVSIPVLPGAPPAPIDDIVYTNEADAIHAVFLRHVADLQAEVAP